MCQVILVEWCVITSCIVARRQSTPLTIIEPRDDLPEQFGDPYLTFNGIWTEMEVLALNRYVWDSKLAQESSGCLLCWYRPMIFECGNLILTHVVNCVQILQKFRKHIDMFSENPFHPTLESIPEGIISIAPVSSISSVTDEM